MADSRPCATEAPGSGRTKRWDGMAELGYEHGRNVQFHFRFGDGELDRLPSLAAELVALAPSVIVTAPLPANLAVARLTTSIPIVLASGADPVGFGLVRSLANPGGNVTGVSNFSEGLPSKQFEVLTQLLPQLAKPAILLNTANKLHEPQARAAAAAASQSGHTLLLAPVRNADDVVQAFSFLTGEQADALLVPPDTTFLAARQQLADLAARARLPVCYGYREHVEAGGLIS